MRADKCECTVYDDDKRRGVKPEAKKKGCENDDGDGDGSIWQW